MARVIADNANYRIGVDFLVLDGDGNRRTYHAERVTADYTGKLTANITWLKNDMEKSKAIALHVYDSTPGGTDYIPSFTPIDWTSSY